MTNQSNNINNPLAAAALLMTAFSDNPAEQLNNFNYSINNLREALNQINNGLNVFNNEVMPMFISSEDQEKDK
ncbi:MAG: hypothetical protein K9L17_07045 [Clostridiales bacterium]|nr:hypothetical protein [Clostridiales bacterium]MCF8022428.1 hypothetical protein [Clostridiales bacterium]